MACMVVGRRTGQWTAKDTGELKEFGKLFVTYPSDGVDGLVAEECRLSPRTIEGVNVGDQVRLDRNQYGKVISVEVIQSASAREKFEQILDSVDAGKKEAKAG